MANLIACLGKSALTLSAIIALSVSIGCAPALPLPTVTDVSSASGANAFDLRTGRTLYIQNCAGCHNLYPPSTRSPLEWKKAMTVMQVKAKIGNETRDAIIKYLLSVTRKSDGS